MDMVHWARRRPEEVDRVAEIPATVAGTFESGQCRVLGCSRLPCLRILNTVDALRNQVARHIRKGARCTPKMRADQVEGVDAVRIPIDHDPIGYEDGCRTHGVI